jgi:hypothetical protein
MPRLTTVKCDGEGCKNSYEISEENPPVGIYEVLQITDTMGKSHWFCSINCLRKWAAKYECPYLVPPSPDKIDDLLPGLN